MLKQYSRNHIIILIISVLSIGLLLLTTPSNDTPPSKKTIHLTTKDISHLATEASLEAKLNTPKIEVPTEKWQKIKVRNGDNLSTLFKRMGLSSKDVYEISTSNTKTAGSNLKKLFPGEQLSFVIKDKRLEKLRRIKSPLETIEFVRDKKGYTVNTQTREAEIKTKFVTATLQSSLFLAGAEAGLTQKLIMELADIFSGVIDFVYDPRKGDSFNVLFEERFIDGKKISAGKILAAQFINQNEKYVAIQYTDIEGMSGHYSPTGVSMRKAFLRSPLDFTRISSGFNLKRKHPIHKSIRAHRGIDYAAPTGTPVFAVGKGRVTAVGYSKANGKYIFVQHGAQYATKYLHLHKTFVTKGQKIKQKQIIGQVGATGYATGPHLHYEFLINGVHRNPRTILNKLPKAKSIHKTEIARFKKSTIPLLSQLNQETLLALNE